MVGENVNDKLGTEEEVAPVFKCANDSEELAIPDWVVTLSFSEGGGVVSYQVA